MRGMLSMINSVLIGFMAFGTLDTSWLKTLFVLSVLIMIGNLAYICTIANIKEELSTTKEKLSTIKEELDEIEELYNDSQEEIEELKLAKETYKSELIKLKKREYINDINKIVTNNNN